MNKSTQNDIVIFSKIAKLGSNFIKIILSFAITQKTILKKNLILQTMKSRSIWDLIKKDVFYYLDIYKSKNTQTEIISQFMYLAAIADSCLSSEPPDCEKELSILRKLFKYLCLDTRIKYLARRNTIDNWT